MNTETPGELAELISGGASRLIFTDRPDSDGIIGDTAHVTMIDPTDVAYSQHFRWLVWFPLSAGTGGEPTPFDDESFRTRFRPRDNSGVEALKVAADIRSRQNTAIENSVGVAFSHSLVPEATPDCDHGA